MSRLRLFVFCLPASWSTWAALYAAQRALLPGRDVFLSAYGMMMYHEAHPVAFIGLVAVAFACVSALAGPAVARQRGGRRAAAVAGVLAGAVVLASVPGGLLYTVFDVRAGFVPSPATLRADLLRNALNGLGLGLVLAVGSVPFSLLALASGWGVLEAALRAARPGTARAVRGVRDVHSLPPLMDDMPDTDALDGDTQNLDPMTPAGTGPTGTGTALDGTMGTAQTGAGAGQHGDDIDPSGADTTGADMTGVGASSPGTAAAPGIAGAPGGAPGGVPDVPETPKSL